MLLRLEPLQEPTVHISFTFKDFPQNLTSPLGWTTQLSHLVVEELEVPSTMHSLDKAAGITSLLEEVIFDVKRQEVRCLFADGGIEEWGFHCTGGHKTGIEAENDAHDGELEGRRLLAMLEGVVRDVRASTQEDERATLEKGKPVVRLERSKSVSVRTGNKLSKHKKQRSMFMQFVSSIGYVLMVVALFK